LIQQLIDGGVPNEVIEKLKIDLQKNKELTIKQLPDLIKKYYRMGGRNKKGP
jgi:hypothetical protein